MKVVTLSEFGEERFLNELKLLDAAQHAGDARNSDWFAHLEKCYNTKFAEWFFLLDNDKLAAFATIQEFYEGCYRLLTRTYIYPDYRRFTLPAHDKRFSPSLYILPRQLEYIQQYKTVFISMQDLKRRNSLARYAQKLEGEWILHPEMIQTCATPGDKNCWQNVIYNGKELELNSMPISDWKKL